MDKRLQGDWISTRPNSCYH